MLLGLDKTYKKEKKDHRCAIQFNFGSRSRRGIEREFNFTTRDKNVPVIKSLKDFWNNLVTVADDAVFDRSLLLCDPMEDMEVILFRRERREYVCVCYKKMRKIGEGKQRREVKFDFQRFPSCETRAKKTDKKKERYPLIFINFRITLIRATRGVKDDGILCVDFFVSRDFYEVHGEPAAAFFFFLLEEEQM